MAAPNFTDPNAEGALTRAERSAFLQPAVIVSVLLAAFETLPALYYGRALVAQEPARASFSFAESFLGTAAIYLLLLLLAGRRRWLGWLTRWTLALVSILLQLLHFGIYRELSTLPSVSVADFARQNFRYASALFVDRLDARTLAVLIVLTYAVARLIRRGTPAQGALRGRFRPVALLGLGVIALAGPKLAKAPFMSVSQHTAWLIAGSLRGPGVVNRAWSPERARPTPRAAPRPFSILLFRLEEVAASATTLMRPELSTTPFLKRVVDGNPEGAFVAHTHFSNATATDVSVLSLFTGLTPAAPLEAHRRIPILWDYFAAAGYDTSLFLPDHLEWGDFRRRFEARPGQLNLHAVIDAGNSGRPLVYDHSITDSDVIEAALSYQERRGWTEPFLQIVSLRMPHASGSGARLNHLQQSAWRSEPELADYYDAILHDDHLMQRFVARIPEPVRQRTALVVASDHGTCLFSRDDGAGVLSRLDNDHVEATRVPFLIELPFALRQTLPAEKLEQLRANLQSRATSNIDVVPTLLGLAGIPAIDVGIDSSELLVGRDLTRATAPTRAIVQLNTGPLRRWDREHFGLVTANGAHHYLFSLGRELVYDLSADPLERTDLAAQPAFASLVAEGRALAAGLPELTRIQRKYAERTAPHASSGESVYTLERFAVHECLRQPPSACPGGFLVWGPYVRAPRGSEVHLRYEIEAARAGLRLWLDISADTGREPLARSGPIDIDAPGSYTFTLTAPIDADRTAIEGRLNARGVGLQEPGALSIRHAELRVAPPS